MCFSYRYQSQMVSFINFIHFFYKVLLAVSLGFFVLTVSPIRKHVLDQTKSRTVALRKKCKLIGCKGKGIRRCVVSKASLVRWFLGTAQVL